MADRPTKALNIRSWPAAPSAGAAFGVLALLLSAAATVSTALLLYDRIQNGVADLVSFALGLLLFLLLAADAAFGCWLVGYFRLRYSADRNAFTINWGSLSEVVPMANITALVPTAQLDQPPRLRRWSGVRWPGYRIGHAEADFRLKIEDFRLEQPEEAVSRELSGSIPIPALPALEPELAPLLLTDGGAVQEAEATSNQHSALSTQHSVSVYATAPDRRLLFVLTDTLVYAISPANQEQFIAEFKTRHALAPTETPAQATVRHGFIAHPLWSDRLAQALIALALLINAALFAYLCIQIPGSDKLALIVHWNALGQPDRTAPIVEAFRLPAFALAIIFVNLAAGLYVQLRDSTAAHFLYAGAAAVQVVFWAAVFNIINR
jgi:hypothetical protein